MSALAAAAGACLVGLIVASFSGWRWVAIAVLAAAACLLALMSDATLSAAPLLIGASVACWRGATLRPISLILALMAVDRLATFALRGASRDIQFAYQIAVSAFAIVIVLVAFKRTRQISSVLSRGSPPSPDM